MDWVNLGRSACTCTKTEFSCQIFHQVNLYVYTFMFVTAEEESWRTNKMVPPVVRADNTNMNEADVIRLLERIGRK